MMGQTLHKAHQQLRSLTALFSLSHMKGCSDTTGHNLAKGPVMFLCTTSSRQQQRPTQWQHLRLPPAPPPHRSLQPKAQPTRAQRPDPTGKSPAPLARPSRCQQDHVETPGHPESPTEIMSATACCNRV